MTKCSFFLKWLCFYYLVLPKTANSYVEKGKRNRKHLPVFYDLNSILDVFHSEQFRYSAICQPTLKTFQESCLNENPKPAFPGKRRPFIVIEGNHGTSNSIVFKRLCKKLGAVCLKKTAKCLSSLTTLYPVNSPLRRAFFGLSLYAQAFSIKQITRRWPVVMNGYWTDQTTFAIARSYSDRDLPGEESPLYNWPGDLLIPDIIFYLNFPEQIQHPFAPSQPTTWKNRIQNVYRKFKNLPIVELKTAVGWDSIISDIENYMKSILKETCYLNFKNISFASYERK